jgi:hypothetical protein
MSSYCCSATADFVLEADIALLKRQRSVRKLVLYIGGGFLLAVKSNEENTAVVYMYIPICIFVLS